MTMPTQRGTLDDVVDDVLQHHPPGGHVLVGPVVRRRDPVANICLVLRCRQYRRRRRLPVYEGRR